jgi:hypothetical protein
VTRRGETPALLREYASVERDVNDGDVGDPHQTVDAVAQCLEPLGDAGRLSTEHQRP